MRTNQIIVACVLGVCGCASAGLSQARVEKRAPRVDDLQQTIAAQDTQIAELAQTIERKNNDITSLQQLLAERDAQLAQKDEQVAQLRKRLEGFGVFQ